MNTAAGAGGAGETGAAAGDEVGDERGGAFSQEQAAELLKSTRLRGGVSWNI
jgi:hypothetical protein